VVVRLQNHPSFVTAMFGIWSMDAVLVPGSPRQPEVELRHTLDTVRPAAVLDGAGLARRDGPPATYEREVAFVTWTSGTTGPPKPILHAHSGYLELLDRVLGSIRSRPPDPERPPPPNLVPVSLALNAGLYQVLFGLRVGTALVLMERFETQAFAELVRRHQIRSTVLPPGAMVMLTDDPALTDLSPLRYVRSITAPLSPLAARRFADRFGVVVLNSYGQAEIGEVVGWTAEDARTHPDKLGAAGRPHRNVALRVVDAAGEQVPEGAVGELLVRPPRMAVGYAGGSELADRVDGDGFVRTGDYGRIDADGFVWIEGRVSDVINRGGNKVFPDQVEEVLRLSPGVSEAAVVGVSDPRLGEVPVAFVVGDAGDDELEELCRRHLTPYKVPVAFRRLPALPRSEVGKVLRGELAAGWKG
jgi:long-chain acyl-CoA synthetase